MFIIHRDQVASFAARRRRRFEEEIRARLAALLGREVELAAIEQSVARAMARGFHTDTLAWQYVALEVELGGDLTAQWLWAVSIIEDEGLTPLGKLRTLLREARARGAGVERVDFVTGEYS